MYSICITHYIFTILRPHIIITQNKLNAILVNHTNYDINIGMITHFHV